MGALKSIATLLVGTTLGACASTPAEPPRDLVQTYEIMPSLQAQGCRLVLTNERLGKYWKANTDPNCPSLAVRTIDSWAPATPGAGVRLYHGREELGDFSPVQDGSGVYLRGGLSDGAVYDLRGTAWR